MSKIQKYLNQLFKLSKMNEIRNISDDPFFREQLPNFGYQSPR